MSTPNQVAKNDRIVWADCEMTGLDPDRHVLVEIAVIVTEDASFMKTMPMQCA